MFVLFVLVLSVQARNTVRSVDLLPVSVPTHDNTVVDMQNTGRILMLRNPNDKDMPDNTVNTLASGKVLFVYFVHVLFRRGD